MNMTKEQGTYCRDKGMSCGLSHVCVLMVVLPFTSDLSFSSCRHETDQSDVPRAQLLTASRSHNTILIVPHGSAFRASTCTAFGLLHGPLLSPAASYVPSESPRSTSTAALLPTSGALSAMESLALGEVPKKFIDI